MTNAASSGEYDPEKLKKLNSEGGYGFLDLLIIYEAWLYNSIESAAAAH
jgi:hypothetical protein